MRIAVLGNLKQNAPAADRPAPDAWAELDSATTMDTIVGALARAGHEARFFEGDVRLVHELPAWRADLCFNLCEGHFGEARESHVPALLEMLRIPYTGAGVTALALTLDKPLTKRVLRDHGIATAPFQVFRTGDEPRDPGLAFPLVVKPAREGSGMGITDASKVHDEDGLRAAVRQLVAEYRQEALVERFLPGREVTVGMLGNGADLRVLPIYEVLLDGGMYTDRVKNHWEGEWTRGRHFECPAHLDDAAAKAIADLATATFHATGCRDVARCDVRLDADGRPMVLEINALPGLSPGWSDLTWIAGTAGLSYDDLVLAIVDAARKRVGV